MTTVRAKNTGDISARSRLVLNSQPESALIHEAGINGDALMEAVPTRLKSGCEKVIAGQNTSTDTYNSRGGTLISVSGIDLIAGNDDSKLQPMVKGNNLLEAMDAVIERVNELNGIVDTLLTAQLEFNSKLMSHTHPDIVNIVIGSLGAKMFSKWEAEAEAITVGPWHEKTSTTVSKNGNYYIVPISVMAAPYPDEIIKPFLENGGTLKINQLLDPTQSHGAVQQFKLLAMKKLEEDLQKLDIVATAGEEDAMANTSIQRNASSFFVEPRPWQKIFIK